MHLSALLDLLAKASPTLWVLIGLSIVALAIGLERMAQLLQARRRLWSTRTLINQHVQHDMQAAAAAAALAASDRPHVASQLLINLLSDGTLEPAALRRAQAQIVRQLRRRLWLLGTMGSLAPFVGLFGTVLGVMQAFSALAQSGGGGFEVVGAGVSEALVTTAAGIFVGIEAVVLYNALQTLLTLFAAELGDTTEELAEARLRAQAR